MLTRATAVALLLAVGLGPGALRAAEQPGAARPVTAPQPLEPKPAGVVPPDEGARTLAYGRHLALECSGCHRPDGIDNGIPSIVGWPQDRFVAALSAYKSGGRSNAVMVSVARSLDDAQIEALSRYYGTLPKPAAADASRGAR